jgi:hypothetical protein
MTRPRLTRWRLAGVALLALVVLAVDAWWSAAPGRVTRVNFNRVRNGMTEGEVSALLGPCLGYMGGTPEKRVVWKTGPACVTVDFRDGLVIGGECHGTGAAALVAWVWHRHVMSRLYELYEWGRP